MNQSGRTGCRLPSGARGIVSSLKRKEWLWGSHQPPNGVLPRRGKVPKFKNEWRFISAPSACLHGMDRDKFEGVSGWP